MVSFASAGILGLLSRSLATSARLDSTIAQMTRSAAGFAHDSGAAGAVETIAALTGAAGVAIFTTREGDRYDLAASFGTPVQPGKGALTLPLGEAAVLAIAHEHGRRPPNQVLQLATRDRFGGDALRP